MKNNPKRIFVHCTATPAGRDVTATDIDRWHKEKGWAGIGYHAVVRLDGAVEKGRDTNKNDDSTDDIGAHCYGHNRDTLAVVYVGGCNADMKPADTRTAAQRAALLSQVRAWMKRFRIPLSQVFGHYEFDSGKACPSFDMHEFCRELYKTL